MKLFVKLSKKRTHTVGCKSFPDFAETAGEIPVHSYNRPYEPLAGWRHVEIFEITAWENQRNNRDTSVDWQFTTDDARIKLDQLYPVLENS